MSVWTALPKLVSVETVLPFCVQKARSKEVSNL